MSSKKRVRFSEGSERGGPAKRRRKGQQSANDFDPDVEDFHGPTTGVTTKGGAEREKKHTLDSDEEEEEDYEQYDVEEFEGQEEETIEYDEETKITPFNMKDEMDDGHFDSEGTFIFKKDKEEIKDAWLDNIDWNMVKKNAGTSWHKESETVEETDDVDEDEPIGDFKLTETSTQRHSRIDIYTEMLRLLKPGETITRCLKRLGGNKSEVANRQHRWQKKKEAAKQGDTVEVKQESGAPEAAESSCTQDLLRLTELVDKLVANGEFEAYSYTHEKIQFELDSASKASQPLPKPADDLDMFADESTPVKSEAEESAKTTDAASVKAEKSIPDEVQWYFKWKDTPDAAVFGPYNSEQMHKWKEENYFEGGVFVRRNTTEQFYSSKRIDFELYT